MSGGKYVYKNLNCSQIYIYICIFTYRKNPFIWSLYFSFKIFFARPIRVVLWSVSTILYRDTCRLPANGKTLSLCSLSLSAGRVSVHVWSPLVYTAAIKIFPVLRPKFPRLYSEESSINPRGLSLNVRHSSWHAFVVAVIRGSCELI